MLSQIQGLKGADFRSERADFRPEKADFRPERANFRSARAESRPERATFRSERPDGDKETERRTEGWINESPPVFYRTSFPSGPLPKKQTSQRPHLTILSFNILWKNVSNQFKLVLYILHVCFCHSPDITS